MLLIEIWSRLKAIFQLCVCVLSHYGLQPPGFSVEFCHSLLQGIFLTQRSNPHLLHWQADSLPLCHPGSPFFSQFHLIVSIFFYSYMVYDSLTESSYILKSLFIPITKIWRQVCGNVTEICLLSDRIYLLVLNVLYRDYLEL